MGFDFYYMARLARATYLMYDAEERFDRMLYIDAPRLRAEYMLKLGGKESEVLSVELDAEMQRRKKLLIQIALNRGDAPNSAEIDADIASQRDEELRKLRKSGNKNVSVELPEPDEQLRLQDGFRAMIDGYDRIELMVCRKDGCLGLMNGACEAYHIRDFVKFFALFDRLRSEEEPSDTPGRTAKNFELTLLTDKVFPCFEHDPSQSVFLEQYRDCEVNRSEIEAGIRTLGGKFPFSAEALLADHAESEKYLEGLGRRLSRAEDSCRRDTEKIDKLINSAADNPGKGKK